MSTPYPPISAPFPLMRMFRMILACVLIGAPCSGDTTDTLDSVATEKDPFQVQVDAVLARNYPGADTAALLAKVQQGQQWGEKNDRLVEAEGLLHWDMGDWQLAMISFRRISNPGPLAMGLMAEGFMRKGDRYEAAAWYLKSARAYGPRDSSSDMMYGKYLEVKPGDVQAELEKARGLEARGNFPQAIDIYLRHTGPILRNLKNTLRIGTLLASQGRAPEAVKLYARGLETWPRERELHMRIAQARETLGQRAEAAQAWNEAWLIDPSDTLPRNRAMAHLEATGQAARLKALLEKAVEADGADHGLRFKLAVAYLRDNDRPAAYFHLSKALATSPGNPTYQSRLPDIIEGDSLIRLHFPYLKSAYEKQGVTPRLLQLAARGFSLAGSKRKSCQAWAQAYAMSPQSLEGRRDVILDLGACGDPAYLSLAGRIGEKLLDSSAQGSVASDAPDNPQSRDREVVLLLLRTALQDRQYARSALAARRLVRDYPEETGAALAAARTLLAARQSAEARVILVDMAERAKAAGMVPGPETSLLLGGILYAEKDCAHAMEYLDDAKEAYPEAGKQLGLCQAERKDLQGAAREYEEYYAKKGDQESLRSLARIYRDLGDTAKERESLEALSGKAWAGEADRLRLGYLYLDKGDSVKAAELFFEQLRNRAALPADSGWADASLFLGGRLAGEQKYDRAIKHLSMGLKARPGRIAAWKSLGDSHAARRQWKEAYAAYDNGFGRDSARLDLALLRLQAAKKLEGKKELLAQAYRAVARLDSSQEEAIAFLAKLHQSAREYKEAAFFHRRLASTHPEDGKAWASLGNCLAMIPNLAEAADPLQKAIDLGLAGDEVYINRARTYRQEGAKDMAASILQYLLEQNPKNQLALLWSAKFAEEDGNTKEAAEFFKRASRTAPARSQFPELADHGNLDAKLVR